MLFADVDDLLEQFRQLIGQRTVALGSYHFQTRYDSIKHDKSLREKKNGVGEKDV